MFRQFRGGFADGFPFSPRLSNPRLRENGNQHVPGQRRKLVKAPRLKPLPKVKIQVGSLAATIVPEQFVSVFPNCAGKREFLIYG
jgi:hypothetical protein